MTSPAKKSSASREGAPELETPETPKGVPADAPRRDETRLQTPEAPAPVPVPSEEDLADLKKDDLKKEAAAHDLPVSGTKSELAERIVEQAQAEANEAEAARLAQESLHVSCSPVDAHAPVWVARSPNSP